MKKGNVLVIGNSGVGKSTLINAVLGNEVSIISQKEDIAIEPNIYEGEFFNIIDTVGFKPSILKTDKSVLAIKKWSKKSARKENEDKQINVIWFCVDGRSGNLISKDVKELSKSISVWKSVPIIVVITKSYAVPEREENIELVKTVFSKNKELNGRLRNIIPVVASNYVLNENASAPQEGITELIDATNELMPEGFKAAQKDVSKFNLNRKRIVVQSTILASVGTAVAKCFINMKASDSKVLAGIEYTMVEALAKTYNIDKKSETMLFIKDKISNGTVNKIARTAIATIEKLPITQKLGTLVNPIIAASVVVIIGEGVAIAFEKEYLGENDSNSMEKLKKSFDSEMVDGIVEYFKLISKNLSSVSSPKEIITAVSNSLKNKKKKNK